jgi:hypothetical protein
MQEHASLGVFGKFALHRSNDTQLIGMPRKIWEQLADLHSRLPVFRERERAPKALAILIELRRVDRRREDFSMAFAQLRLWVPCVDLRWPTVHKKEDHPLGFGREMKPIFGLALDRSRSACQPT